MRKLNEYIKYDFRGYRYAPESFKSYKVFIDPTGKGNHSWVPLNLSHEQEREIGYLCITKGQKAAESLAKKYDRERNKKPKKFITYGFLDTDNSKQYHYTQDLYCQINAPLDYRYRIYKSFKDYLLGLGCKVARYDQCQLDGNYKPTDVKTVYDIVDITKPVVVFLRA